MGFAQQIYVVFLAIFLFGSMRSNLLNILHQFHATHFAVNFHWVWAKSSSCLHICTYVHFL